MNFCRNCGILLFTEIKGRSLCSACQLYNAQLIKLFRTPSCKCQYCTRSFDWEEIAFSSGGIMGQYCSTSHENEKESTSLGPKYDLIDENLRRKWEKEQLQLKQKLSTEDCSTIRRIRQQIESNSLGEGELFVGGVDISFIKGDDVNACSAFVVLSYPDLEVVYEDYQMVKLTAPYIPGFLAFREVEFIVQQYKKLKQTKPEYLPQVIFVDGNGILHPRGFGLASHLGVLLDVACLGVAKTLIHVDGLENDGSYKEKKTQLKKGGDTYLLQTSSGDILGKALRSCDNTTNPIYVSLGHKISLETAVWLVMKCCKYRIPEPTRKADLNSREYLRVNHPQGCQE